MHGLVVGGILLFVVSILHPSDVGIGSIDTEVDGNAARFIVEVYLNDTTLLAHGVTKSYFISARRNGQQFESHVEHATDTDGICLVRVPIAHITVNADVSLVAHLPVGDVLVLESREDVLTIPASTIAIHEIRTKHCGIDADATIEHDITHLCSVSQDVVDIMI